MTLSAEIVTLLESLKARGATNTELAMACWLVPTIELERTIQVLRGELGNVNRARGFALSLIGKLVGQERQGVTDDEEYRRYVRARIAANRSNGVINDILRVARLVVYDEDATLVNQNHGAAGYTLRVEGIALPTSAEAPLVDLVLDATSDGVRAQIGYSTDPPSEVLRFSTQGVLGTGKFSHLTDRRG